MIPRAQGNIRLLRDLLIDEMRETRRLKRLVAMLRLENTLLRQRDMEFDLSADAELPCLLRKQA